MELGYCFSSSWIMVFTSVLLGGLLAFYGLLMKANEWFYVTYRLGKKQRQSLPPGDMGWPFIGTQLSFLKAFKSKDPDSFISNLAARYGPTGIYRAVMFGKPCVIVTTPESCKRVLSDDTTFGPGYPQSITKLMGKKAFHGISYDEHKRLRRLTTPPLSGQEALSAYLKHVEDIVVSCLEGWARTDKPIEFLTETRKIAFEVIMYVMMGDKSTDHLIMDALEKEYTVLNRGLKSMAIDLPGFAYHNALKARKNLQKIFQSVVDERRMMIVKKKKKKTIGDDDRVVQGGGDSGMKKDMMDLLMGVEDENGVKLSDEEIVDLIIMFLNAGHESSGHAIMWAVLLLHDHPHVFQTAKAEQEEIVRRRPPTQSGLSLKETKQMEYLSKVIDETLRWVNISFTLFREATTDVNINGHLVPKGWRILPWLRSAHLDSDKYDNSKEFDPSRWDDPKTRTNYIPFGAGSRLCPGRDLARLEVYIFLHHFLLHYKLERVNPECEIKYLPISRPADNCLARIKKA